jgi:hypothetical protein
MTKNIDMGGLEVSEDEVRTKTFQGGLIYSGVDD